MHALERWAPPIPHKQHVTCCKLPSGGIAQVLNMYATPDDLKKQLLTLINGASHVADDESATVFWPAFHTFVDTEMRTHVAASWGVLQDNKAVIQTYVCYS